MSLRLAAQGMMTMRHDHCCHTSHEDPNSILSLCYLQPLDVNICRHSGGVQQKRLHSPTTSATPGCWLWRPSCTVSHLHLRLKCVACGSDVHAVTRPGIPLLARLPHRLAEQLLLTSLGRYSDADADMLSACASRRFTKHTHCRASARCVHQRKAKLPRYTGRQHGLHFTPEGKTIPRKHPLPCLENTVAEWGVWNNIKQSRNQDATARGFRTQRCLQHPQHECANSVASLATGGQHAQNVKRLVLSARM